MSIQSFINLPARTASVDLLAFNSAHKHVRHETVIGEPLHLLQRLPPEATGTTLRIGLPHMDVVLSISAEPGNGAIDDAGFAALAAHDGMPADPVIERLLRELGEATGSADSDGIRCDAIRLALLARWLGLRSQSACDAQQDATDGALQKWRLKRVMGYIDDHIGEAILLADLARAAGLSRMYFAARFRASTGLRPHEYVLRQRVEQAKDMLLKTNESLVEIAFNVGFQTQAHFTTVFKRFTGITPGRWRLLRRFA